MSNDNQRKSKAYLLAEALDSVKDAVRIDNVKVLAVVCMTKDGRVVKFTETDNLFESDNILKVFLDRMSNNVMNHMEYQEEQEKQRQRQEVMQASVRPNNDAGIPPQKQKIPDSKPLKETSTNAESKKE